MEKWASKGDHLMGPYEDAYKVVKLSLADRWFIRHHWHGEPHQQFVYRCQGCRRILTHRHIKNGPCICGTNRLSSTRPTYLEILRLYVLPWSFYWGRLLSKEQRKAMQEGVEDGIR